MAGQEGAGPVLLWFRRDLRLDDHPALVAAAAAARQGGGGLIPLFIHDETVEPLGAAARLRLGLAVQALAGQLAAAGSRLLLRRGPARAVIEALVAETGAGAVHWTRGYDPAAIARDSDIKARLGAAAVTAASHPGTLLAEPWEVRTAQGGFFRVYTPFRQALRRAGVAAPLPAPARLPAPDRWPQSDDLAAWRMAAGMDRGAAVVAPRQQPGGPAALDRLAEFLDTRLAGYAAGRDFPARDATSGLSEHLAWGEISPRRIWHAAWPRLEAGLPGADKFLSELAWRDFAWHLAYHSPAILTRNWRDGWDGFPWRGDNDDAEAWRRGRTGEPMVDAAMREMFVTGRMHNRARMIAASYLTKHLLTDWRVGLAWFADCLTDWDPAANALGWQWVAGTGPDAAPWFRVFNPAVQAGRHDPDHAWRRRWIAEGAARPHPDALAWFHAVPRSWGLSPADPYPPPIVDLARGRARALAAYATRGGDDGPSP